MTWAKIVGTSVWDDDRTSYAPRKHKRYTVVKGKLVEYEWDEQCPVDEDSEIKTRGQIEKEDEDALELERARAKATSAFPLAKDKP